jgi:DNA-binding MarR family transcriptional regulator
MAAAPTTTGTGTTTGHDPTAGAGPALFRLVRFWSRRWATRSSTAEGLTGDDQQIQDIMVLEAVEAAAERTTEVSVADVAHQLGIDRSGASRLVTGAAGRGYLHRDTSGQDARRAAVAVTPAGADLLASAHAWQQETYHALTRHWDPAEVASLAGHLRRLAAELADHPPRPAHQPTPEERR